MLWLEMKEESSFIVSFAFMWSRGEIWQMVSGKDWGAGKKEKILLPFYARIVKFLFARTIVLPYFMKASSWFNE